MPATSQIPTQQVIDGQLITAALWNSEFGNIFNLMVPSGIDTYSATDAQMQLQTNPYPGSVTSHATSLAGELERIRYQIALLINGGSDFWYRLPTSNVNALANTNVPIGGCIDFPVATPPNTSWRLADGTAVSRTTYASLFALIGATFGAGDGVSTFNLPDFRDRMAIGAGNAYGAGATGGEATHVLTISEMPLHTHTLVDTGHAHTISDPQHSHVQHAGTPGGGDNNFTMNPLGGSALGTTGASATNISVNSNSSNISASTSGGDAAHNNLPPYIGMFKMIRVL